jgi:hypothetical protein
MADFNADNAAIDAAVGAIPRKRLFDVTLTAAASTIQLDLTGIDLSKYVELEIYAFLASDTSKGMRINNVCDSRYEYKVPSGGASTTYMKFEQGKTQLILCDIGKMVCKPAKDFYVYAMARATYFPQLNTLDFFDTTAATYPFAVGDRIIVWGLKI